MRGKTIRSTRQGIQWLKIHPEHALLPCRRQAILYRTAYQQILSALQEKEEKIGVTKETACVGEQREKSERYAVITIDQGVGKSIFLSVLLVERLLAGLPTILDVGKMDVTQPEPMYLSTTLSEDVRHDYILFCNYGVYWLSDPEFNFSFIAKDPLVWVLAQDFPRLRI